MIRAAISLCLVLPLLILWPLPARAQVRPGLAHQLEAADPLDSETRAPQAATHDPDSDGALIGAGIGAAAGIIIVCRGICSPAAGEGLGAFAFTIGAVVGGLAGLVVGGLVDAADPLTDRQAAMPPDTAPPAPPPNTIAAVTDEPSRACSRRNDAFGAAIGAGTFAYLFRGLLSNWGLAGASAIGAILGAGIGSAVPEDAEQEGCSSSRKSRSRADSSSTPGKEPPWPSSSQAIPHPTSTSLRAWERTSG